MAMIAAPITPARSPSRHGTIRRSRVASGSERLKIPSRTPARSCACASAMSPPITITAGLKKVDGSDQHLAEGAAVDELIAPAETRARLGWALGALR